MATPAEEFREMNDEQLAAQLVQTQKELFNLKFQAAVEKIAGLRVFRDEQGRMNRSLGEVGGEILVVSQFTLLGEVRRGRRPSFTRAAQPEVAAPLIDFMVEEFRCRGITTAQGAFGEFMSVEINNDGPITLVIDVTKGRVV